MFEKLTTKKNVFIFSGLMSVLLVGWDYIGNYSLCDFLSIGSNGGCPQTSSHIEVLLISFVAIFIFSLITYWLRGEVFKTWVRFTLVWLPLSALLTLFTREHSLGMYFYWSKGATAMLLAVLFLIISSLVVVVRSIRLRGGVSK